MEIRVAPPSPPLTGQSRGRGEPGIRAVLLDTPRRGRQSLGRHLGPRGLSILFFSCLPSPTREMKLLGWATEAAETRLLRGSGVPCLGSGGVAAPPTLALMMGPGVPSNRPCWNVSVSAEPTPCPHPTSECPFLFPEEKRLLRGPGLRPKGGEGAKGS